MKKITKDFISTLLTKVTLPFFSFVFIYVFSKILSIEDFGTISYLLNLILFIEALSSLSLTDGLLYTIAKGNGEKRKEGLSSSITLFTLISILLLILSIPIKIIFFSTFSNSIFFLLLLNIFSFGIFNIFNFFDQGLEKFSQKNLLLGLKAVLKILPITLYLLTYKLSYIFLGELLTTIIPVFIYLIKYKKILVFKIYLKDLKKILNFSKYVHTVKVSSILLNLVTQTFLFSISVRSFALYYAATKLTGIISSIPLSVISISMPKIFKDHKNEKYIYYIKMSIKYLSIFYGYLVILLILSSKMLISFVYSEEFTGSTIVFNIIIVAIVIDYIIYIGNPNLSAGNIKKAAKAIIFKNSITLIASLILITKFLELGAGLSLLISSVFGNILLLKYNKDLFNKEFFKNSIKIVSITLFVLVMLINVNNIYLKIFYSTIMYVFLIFITKTLSINDLKKVKDIIAH